MKSQYFSDQFDLPTYNLSSTRITRLLLSAIATLIFLNLVERTYVFWFNANHEAQLISHYFNFDQEFNLPSLYSAFALGLSSYILAIIALIKQTSKSRYAKHWKILGFIFLFLAFDEACSIHELLNPIIGKAINAQGFLYFAWVIPGFILLMIFLFAFRKFIKNLPIQTRTLFICAGFIYVAGALGMELIGGYVADNYGYGSVYGIVSSIEEILEMLGVIIFIHGLLNYLQSKTNELHFSFSFKRPENKYLG